MSDSGAPDDDVGLPKATVYKLISGASARGSRSLSDQPAALTRPEMLPADMACSKEAKDVMVDCCVGASPSALHATLVALPRLASPT
jgi:hypothetical protein